MKIKFEWDNEEQKEQGLLVLGASLKLKPEDQTHEKIEEELSRRFMPVLRHHYMRGLIERTKSDPALRGELGPGATGLVKRTKEFLQGETKE